MCLYAGQAVLATPLTFVHKIYMNVWWKKAVFIIIQLYRLIAYAHTGTLTKQRPSGYVLMRNRKITKRWNEFKLPPSLSFTIYAVIEFSSYPIHLISSHFTFNWQTVKWDGESHHVASRYEERSYGKALSIHSISESSSIASHRIAIHSPNHAGRDHGISITLIDER